MLKRFLRSLLGMIADNSSSSNEVRKRAANEAVSAAAKAEEQPAVKKERRPKNVKYAMLLSYQGQNYFGMQYQRNEQFPTIEKHLLSAMHKHGFITEEQRSDLFPWYFQRAARTDRSVSAVRQICSMQLPLDQNFIQNGPALLNSSLTEDIRVFGIKRVTPCFHAQKYCDGRTYSYTLPTFALAPCDQLTTSDYRIPEERIAETQELLNCFLGVHNFYNYTSKLEHTDERVKRNIREIRCEKPFLYTESLQGRQVEFMSIYIKGQSFMLHQIRKMIGATLAILRGFMYKSDLQRSFMKDRMDIPRAPGLGLLLERLHYDRFEQRFLKSHGSLNDWGEQVERDILEWRNRMIVERILAEECRTQSMMFWLSTLLVHRYILDPEDERGENVSALSDATRNALRAMNPDDPFAPMRGIDTSLSNEADPSKDEPEEEELEAVEEMEEKLEEKIGNEEKCTEEQQIDDEVIPTKKTAVL